MGTDVDLLEIIKRRIIRKYGTMKNLADQMGISDATLNNNIKLLSRKFEIKLQQFGIDTGYEETNITESTIIGTVAGNNQTVYNKGDNDKLKECEERNKLLEVEVEHLRVQVKTYKDMFDFVKKHQDLQAEKNKPQQP